MKKKVLVIAKTEPSPSKKHGATVCTAGITDKGEFIRLYPMPFRLFCDDTTGFNKYDWIEVDCEQSDNDTRSESYKVDEDSIRCVGHIGTDYNWSKRNRIILPRCSKNFKELEEKGASLGLIKPSDLLSFEKNMKADGPIAEPSSNYRKVLQMIFDKEGSLKKIPHIESLDRYYRYGFRCDGEETIHKVMCEDWELYQSSRSWLDRYKTEEETWNKIHETYYRYFKEECNLHFFVGTHYLWNTWIIIGLYYPPNLLAKGQQMLIMG